MSFTISGIIEYMDQLNAFTIYPGLKYDGNLIVPTTAAHRYRQPIITTAQLRRMIHVEKFNLSKISGDIKQEGQYETT